MRTLTVALHLLTKELKDWAQNAKKRGLIRFFGFSTHSNMADCLNAAAKLDWIDAIMVLYNWRIMQEKQMQDAIEACYNTGIGLTAMKTQGRGQDKKIETEADKKLTEHFIKRGFTAGQAKLKVILDDKRISSVAVGRGNIPHLREDIAAAMDKTGLTLEDKLIFRQVAAETCSGYCTACTNLHIS
jgi:predicted aldo/keto reductase-like oxidoreductase